MRLERGEREAAPPVRLIRLAGVFVVFLLLLSAVWSFVAPSYNRVILGIALPVISLIESPDVTAGRATGGDISIYRNVGLGHEPVLFVRFTQYVFVGLVPLLALFLASPNLRMARRLKLTAVGALVMGGFHVGYLVAAVELGYVFVGLTHVGRLEYGLCDWIQVLFRVTWESAAVLIWALLVPRDWFRAGLQRVSGHGGAACRWTCRLRGPAEAKGHGVLGRIGLAGEGAPRRVRRALSGHRAGTE